MSRGQPVLLTILALTLLLPGASALATSVPATRAAPSGATGEGAWDLGVDGSGVVIAILDTGVDNEHPALQGAYVAGASGFGDLVDTGVKCEDPDDNDGHGTHVAGIAMSRGGGDVAKGVAPGASLVDVKIAQDFTGISKDGIRRGIEWVLAYNAGESCYGDPGEHRVDVISLSFGSFTPGDPNSTHAHAVQEAVDAGITVVVAAGNCGPQGSLDCTRHGDNTIASPGIAPAAITVAATDHANTPGRSDDAIAGYSSRGPGGADRGADPKPNLAAPGTDIHSTRYNPFGPATGSMALSGTSMAAPHVSGVAALMLQANPGLAPGDVKAILEDTAEDRGPLGWDAAWGHGYVDAHAAVQEAQRRGAEDLEATSDGGGDPAGNTTDGGQSHGAPRANGTDDGADGNDSAEGADNATGDGNATSGDGAASNDGAAQNDTASGEGEGAPAEPANEAPVANLTATPRSPRAGEAVDLDATGSRDPDGRVARYEWDLDGDGAVDARTSTGRVTKTYDAAGEVTVTVRVVDDDGAASAPATLTLTVEAPREPPAPAPEPAPPHVTILTPREGAELLPGEVRVRWNGTSPYHEVHLDGVIHAVTADASSPVWLEPGAHTIRVVGVSPDGSTVEAVVNITATPGPEVNKTVAPQVGKGADVDTVPGATALALLAALAAAALLARRR